MRLSNSRRIVDGQYDTVIFGFMRVSDHLIDVFFVLILCNSVSNLEFRFDIFRGKSR